MEGGLIGVDMIVGFSCTNFIKGLFDGWMFSVDSTVKFEDDFGSMDCENKVWLCNLWIFNPVMIPVIREENNYLQRKFLPGDKSAAILVVHGGK